MEEDHRRAGSPGLVPFAQFLQDTRTGRFEDYRNAPCARVADEAAFEEMKAMTRFATLADFLGQESLQPF
jgi:hypothetical protein